MQRRFWGWVLLGLSGIGWILGVGAGARGWLIAGPELGWLGHTQYFASHAQPFFLVSALLTLTAVTIGIGAAIVSRMVPGADGALVPTLPTLEEVPTLPDLAPIAAADGGG